MTQQISHRGQGNPSADQPRRAGMPQVVDVKIHQPRPMTGRVKRAPYAGDAFPIRVAKYPAGAGTVRRSKPCPLRERLATVETTGRQTHLPENTQLDVYKKFHGSHRPTSLKIAVTPGIT